MINLQRKKKFSRFSVFLLVFAYMFSAIGGQAYAEDLSFASKKSGIDINNAKTLTVDNTKKENLSESKKKLGSDLLRLVDDSFLLPSQTRSQVLAQMKELNQFVSKTESVKTIDKRVTNKAHNDLVYVYVNLNPSVKTSVIDSIVWNVTDRDEENHLAVALVDVTKLEALASLGGVKSVRSVLPPITNTGSVVTEGDVIHQTHDVRSTYSQSGAGMKIGVISDGVDHIATAKSTGDLPAGVTVLSNSEGGDEGTAMLEIIYDMVPSASLYFHDCGSNVVAFNSAIDDLVTAGVNVIVDDIGWIGEPFFEDGTIASHVTSVLASNNIVYVSAAGNSAQEHYQGNYYNDGSNFHDFSRNPTTNDYLYLDIPSNGKVTVVLEWNDSFGHSGNDYDLHLYDTNGFGLLAISEDSQNGNDDPIEVFSYTNTTGGPITAEIDVSNYNGLAAAKTLELFIYSSKGTDNSPNNITTADSIFGHPAVPGVIAVGAISSTDPGNDTIESFSSQGPVTINSQAQRAKPDISGIDRVSVTGAGGFYTPFSGTSAAAPHIAAIAAQLWGQYPTATATQIKNHILNTAVDLGASGNDNIFGHGRADALLAFQSGLMASFESAVSDDNVSAGIVEISKISDTNGVELYAFDIEETGGVDANITEMTMSFQTADPTVVGSKGDIPTNVIRMAYLLRNGEVVGAESMTSSGNVVFDNLDIDIGSRATDRFTIEIDIEDTNNGTRYGEGTTAIVTVGAITHVTDVNGGDEKNMTGLTLNLASEIQELRTEGVKFTFVSQTSEVISPVEGASQQGKYIIKFNAMAFGADSTLSDDGDCSSVDYAVTGGTTPGFSCELVTSLPVIGDVTGTTFKLGRGVARLFRATVVVTPDATGFYRVSVDSFKWGGVAGTTNTYDFDMGDYVTDSKRLNYVALSSNKDITSFGFSGLGSGVITGTDITVEVPLGTDVTALVPSIEITGASIDPASGVANDFTSPVTYTVTAEDSSTKIYIVTVNLIDPDIAKLAADKAALVDDSIKGSNADLSNITEPLTNPLPSTGANGSTITWESSDATVVSDDGQTIDRPTYGYGDINMTLTATLTKGAFTDTKVFDLTVLEIPGSSIATVTSEAYTVSAGGTDEETIINVPFGTAKSDFLSALTKGEENQVWDDKSVSDPVVTGDVLMVTAQDGTTVLYTITTSDDPDIAKVTADREALNENDIKGENSNLIDIELPLTDPLPSVGTVNASTITWKSSNTKLVSDDGQEINSPAFADDNTITLTASLTKGAITQTRVFTITVLRLPASDVATVTSETYTVSVGGTGDETIINVPFGTSKAVFLASLTKDEAHQTFDSTDIADPVVSGNKLKVTAQDGTTEVVYTVTVSPDIIAPTGSISNITAGSTVKGTVTIDVTASDVGSGVSKVEFWYDTVNKIGEDTVAPYSIDWNTTAKDVVVLDGSHTLFVIVYDNAGNSYQSVDLSVTVKNAKSGGGGGGGGGGTVKKPIVPVVETPIIEIPLEVELQSTDVPSPFTDIVGHWAETYIETLRLNGYVDGISDGLFLPDAIITRSELIKMAILMNGYDHPEITIKPYKDVPIDSWFGPYVTAGRLNKIIWGFWDGTFRPNQKVTRVEALKVLLDATKEDLTTSTSHKFSDTNSYAWYAKYINFAYQNGIIAGYDNGKFGPYNYITRAEFAKLEVLLMRRSGKIF